MEPRQADQSKNLGENLNLKGGNPKPNENIYR